jgi:hypothetical protein
MEPLSLFGPWPRALNAIQHLLGQPMVLLAIALPCGAWAQDSGVGGQADTGSGSQQSTVQRVEIVAR